MSKYTIQLNEIIDLVGRDTVESYFKDYELTDYLTQEQIDSINNAGIWNKDKLAKKIVDHYFLREIGSETIGIFKHYCKVLMQELMEQKLPIIYSNSIKFDPLVNVDYKEEYQRNIDTNSSLSNISNSNSNSSSNSSSNGSGLNVRSDTPQGQINKSEILNGKYASNTDANSTENQINDESKNNINTTTKNDGTNNTNENYTKRIVGNSGITATAQNLLKQYRDTIVAVDKDIINECNILFMGLY